MNPGPWLRAYDFSYKVMLHKYYNNLYSLVFVEESFAKVFMASISKKYQGKDNMVVYG